MRLIDLERAGLGEYRAQLDRFLAEQGQKEQHLHLHQQSHYQNISQMANMGNVGSVAAAAAAASLSPPHYQYNNLGQGAAPVSINQHSPVQPVSSGGLQGKLSFKLRLFH